MHETGCRAEYFSSRPGGGGERFHRGVCKPRHPGREGRLGRADQGPENLYELVVDPGGESREMILAAGDEASLPSGRSSRGRKSVDRIGPGRSRDGRALLSLSCRRQRRARMHACMPVRPLDLAAEEILDGLDRGCASCGFDTRCGVAELFKGIDIERAATDHPRIRHHRHEVHRAEGYDIPFGVSSGQSDRFVLHGMPLAIRRHQSRAFCRMSAVGGISALTGQVLRHTARSIHKDHVNFISDPVVGRAIYRSKGVYMVYPRLYPYIFLGKILSNSEIKSDCLYTNSPSAAGLL